MDLLHILLVYTGNLIFLLLFAFNNTYNEGIIILFYTLLIRLIVTLINAFLFSLLTVNFMALLTLTSYLTISKTDIY